jgi:outer membrane protein
MLKACVLALCLLLPSTARADRALSLADALAIAKQQRAEVLAAALARVQARLDVAQAALERVQASAQVTFTPQLQRNNINGPSRLCTLQQDICQTSDLPVHATVGVLVPLFDWGMTEAHLLGARARQRAADWQARATAETVALDAAHAYWATRRAELATALLATAIERNQELEEMTRVRAQSGITPMVDYTRARLLVMQQRAQLALLQGQVADAHAQLAVALQIDGPLVLDEAPEAHRPPPAAAPGDDDAAARARPELHALGADVDAERWAVHAAWAALGPHLAGVFSGSGALQPFSGLDPLHPDAVERRFVMQGYLGLQLSWTVLDPSLVFKLRAAQVQRQQAEVAVTQMRVRVRAEIESARARLAAQARQTEVLEQAVALARGNLDNLRKRYKVGSALLLEVLDAQTNLLQVELDLVDGRIGMATAEAELRAALGTL